MLRILRDSAAADEDREAKEGNDSHTANPPDSIADRRMGNGLPASGKLLLTNPYAAFLLLPCNNCSISANVK